MVFEILCLDENENVKSRTVSSLAHTLIGNDSLFEDAELSETKDAGQCKIEDKKKGFHLLATQFVTDQMLTGARYSVAYIISVESQEISALDNLRLILVDYVKSIGFSNVRILRDEVSAAFAATLYSKIYFLENQVRSFIVSFFLKNLGTNWTKLALPAETLAKIKQRKNNDKIFIANEKIEADVSLVDFEELGRVLFSENSILSSKKVDNVTILIQKIHAASDLKALKNEVLEGNFRKYFKDCFVQKDFQKKWTDLCYYRNKIAHNGSFSAEEQKLCSNLCDEISSIIESAYEKLDTFKLSVSDQKTLMEAVNDLSAESSDDDLRESGRFSAISEKDLIDELRKAQQNLPYVGLRHFVVDLLGGKGYDYDLSFTLINYLEDKGSVEIYDETNNSGYLVKAIKIIGHFGN